MTPTPLHLGPSPGGRRGAAGESWQRPLIGVLYGVLFAIVAWMANDAATARAEMTKQINDSVQRIAILEESNRNMRDSLLRIESGVDELRRLQQQQERRR